MRTAVDARMNGIQPRGLSGKRQFQNSNRLRGDRFESLRGLMSFHHVMVLRSEKNRPGNKALPTEGTLQDYRLIQNR